MKLASSEGWTVVPAGAATWLNAGNPLTSVNLVVSTGRLNRIIEHEPADLVTMTEAGVSLKNLNDKLALNGQWLPLDPPDDGSATVGGVVATGLGGAQQSGYGAPRRHVIGMKIVLADGSLIKVGGRVVKNVAGYDLCKLFTGSYGTLGIIVEVNFKLRPLPFETRTILAWGARNKLLEGARSVNDSRLFPVAVELLSPALAAKVEKSQASGHLLLLRFAGSLAGVSQQAKSAFELIGGNQSETGRVESDDATMWRSIAGLPLRFSRDMVWRVGLRPGDIGTFLEILDQTNSDTGSQSMWHAGLADGRVRVVDLRRQGENNSGGIDSVNKGSINQTIKRIKRLRARAQSLGSSLIIENAPGDVNTRLDSWGDFGSAARLMQRVKKQLDPMGVFSPGRFGFNDLREDPP
ncbi:MAG: FAD-binding oxidoreductase [Acidobacteriota bacterium]|nr:FAD-binding oxidoreductase [Acidobacteriota bacterium]